MSKLYDNYCYLKTIDPDTIYIFKSGIFYIFLDKDAKVVSDLFSLKLTNLNENVLKCGFLIQSIDKYSKLFEVLYSKLGNERKYLEIIKEQKRYLLSNMFI